MKKSERDAQEKLKKYDIHTDKKGGRGIEDHAHTQKEGVIRSVRDSLKALRGK
jgi:hypothetical protein